MTDFKEDDYLICNNPCFICFQPVIFSNKETISLVNFLFDYLKLEEEVKFLVCEECGGKLAKFRSLCNAKEKSEKVRLEMDIVFDWIESAIQRSNKDVGWAPVEFVSSREAVMRRCSESIWNPRPRIVLQKIDPRSFASQVQAPDFWNDSSLNLDKEDDESSRSDSEQLDENPAIPEVMGMKQVKTEFDWENVAGNGIKRGEEWSKTFYGKMESVFNAVLQTARRSPNPAAYNSNVCEVCKKSFGSRESLRQHDYYVHRCRKAFQCDTCNKMFRRGADLERHVSAVHEKRRHYCQAPGCSTSFSQRGSLVRHSKLEHPDFIVPRQPRKSMKYRAKLENGVTVFQCRSCKCKFKSVGAIKIHIQRAHEKSEESKGVEIEDSAIP